MEELLVGRDAVFALHQVHVTVDSNIANTVVQRRLLHSSLHAGRLNGSCHHKQQDQSVSQSASQSSQLAN